MMVGGAIAGLAALALVILAVIVLVGVAFFNKRLALFGAALLLAWLFVPVIAPHLSYAWDNRGSPYDHRRSFDTAGFGVTFPDDGSLRRLPRQWTSDPAGSLVFQTRPPGYANDITFWVADVVPLGEVSQSADRLDLSQCPTTMTDFGLLYIETRSCDQQTYDIYHVYITPPDAPNRAMFAKPPYSDPTEMGLVVLEHQSTAANGTFVIAGYVGEQHIDDWAIPIAHITAKIDAYFERLADTPVP